MNRGNVWGNMRFKERWGTVRFQALKGLYVLGASSSGGGSKLNPKP